MTENTKELEEAILKLNDLHPFWGLDAELKAIFEPLIKHARAHLEAAPVLDELIEQHKNPLTNLISYAETCCIFLLDAGYEGKAQSLSLKCKHARESLSAHAQKMIERKG